MAATIREARADGAVGQLRRILGDAPDGVERAAELLRTGQQLVQVLNNPLQMYLAVGLVYIVINACLTVLAGWLERRIARKRRGAAYVAPTTASEAPLPVAANG